MRLESALAAYSEQRVTLNRAAELADLSTWDFLARLATTGGTLHYDVRELEEDLVFINPRMGGGKPCRLVAR